jgi:hypothetical protein
MTKFLTIVFAISLTFSMVSCGDDDGGTCGEACGIVDDLCEGDLDISSCKKGCEETLAEMSPEQVDTLMSCLRNATTNYEAGACVGEEDICH